jgi:4-aminobutyrate aminotransferase-like enzyme/Ser/Thr protein kinase RdoA (MazF antagonist)
MSMLTHTPTVTCWEAEQLLREHYGIEGVVDPLPSDRDQNFRVAVGGTARYVLKIANGLETRAVLEAQQALMAHLGEPGDLTGITPRVCLTLGGEGLCEVSLPPHPIGSGQARVHLIWLISFLPGRPLAEVCHHGEALLRDLGRRLGELDRRLADFDHPAIHRELHWDLARGREVVERHRGLVEDPLLRQWIDSTLEQLAVETEPLLGKLRRSAIHNDLNDYNLLVADDSPFPHPDNRVVGIVDFGDLLVSYTIGDLAIALSYVMLGKTDPLAAARRVVAAYHEVYPLTEEELGALYGLIQLRLCTSVVLAAEQSRHRPDDPYLRISQEPIRRLIPRLKTIPWRVAAATFRAAAGFLPVAKSAHLTAWLDEESPRLAPVVDFDWARDRWLVLDLGVGSPLIEGDPQALEVALLSRRIGEEMAREGASLAVGRYNEARLLYTSSLFGQGAEEGRAWAERRTVHLGIDLFLAAGTEVYAPLPGRVLIAHDNRAPLDYGPVLILEHEGPTRDLFYTLYGHLSRESLDRVSVGQEVAAGEQIGTIGSSEVNGGWPPHLHFQVIEDLLGLGADFPGVCRASQRAVWGAFSPDPSRLLGLPAVAQLQPEPTREETRAVRHRRFGGNLRLGYHDPLKIVRGWMQSLYDETGRVFLDAYNNVPHVGHCHPRVVEAGRRQMGILNTNTRYLHDLLNRYAERLAATLPEGLEVCYFVNSASEANELALRLQRAYTGQRDLIVLEAGYHGHTTSLIDISPYKHAGPGGEGPPPWVHAVPIPDLYRGPYRADNPKAVEGYLTFVEEVIERIEREGRGLGGFIAETCPSVGGQIFLPPEYLSRVYRAVRAAGGVCIADEVQTGYGRIGSSFWAFEEHGVVPDLVVLGKPIGNGHPIGAVVTTRAIADAFDNGMEFFSTFGGNPVSCAIGLAVLEVLEEEGWQAHALKVGQHLLGGLRPLVDRFPVVGDVRGSGLFLGVELVRNRETRSPAPDEATYVVNRMREEGILLGSDGPFHNVLKIRPPMPFSNQDAERLIHTFSRILEECGG